MKLIAQGAESKLFLDDGKIVKDRFRKKYRVKEIDDKLRKFRTKREAKVLEKLGGINFPCPELIKTDKKERIVMSRIKGKLVKEVFDKKYLSLSKEIGKKIGILHNENIIHGDLTTSNMIFNKKLFFIDAGKSKISGISEKKGLFLIDFGLSFFSHKQEDKAVDLHLLRQALESKHHKVWEKAYKLIIKEYEKNALEAKSIVKRLELVEKRGRYKQKH